MTTIELQNRQVYAGPSRTVVNQKSEDRGELAILENEITRQLRSRSSRRTQQQGCFSKLFAQFRCKRLTFRNQFQIALRMMGLSKKVQSIFTNILFAIVRLDLWIMVTSMAAEIFNGDSIFGLKEDEYVEKLLPAIEVQR